ncbi:MAG TPA: type II toxin-antitoxin system HicB family antitoxin [Blastocatellia bacterium]|nr:type II toxin-antitoxin system HicB family antitoxin [Blastocatellia bacterium]
MAKTKAIYLPLIIEPNDDGYLARCPSIQGAFAEGDTPEEAIFNCIDVIKMIAAYRAERRESLGLSEIELTPDMRMTLAVLIGVDE